LEISGDDLIAAGVPEGPRLGRALEETLARKLEGLVDGREQELETALRLAREAS
jgi:tRNA nucleotidyltransferase (CCA-adding enzyme)